MSPDETRRMDAQAREIERIWERLRVVDRIETKLEYIEKGIDDVQISVNNIKSQAGLTWKDRIAIFGTAAIIIAAVVGAIAQGGGG